MSRSPVADKIDQLLKLFDYKPTTFRLKFGTEHDTRLANAKYGIFQVFKGELEAHRNDPSYTAADLNDAITKAAVNAYSARKAYITDIQKKTVSEAVDTITTVYKEPGTFETKLKAALESVNLPVPHALVSYVDTQQIDRHSTIERFAGGKFAGSSANPLGVFGRTSNVASQPKSPETFEPTAPLLVRSGAFPA